MVDELFTEEELSSLPNRTVSRETDDAVVAHPPLIADGYEQGYFLTDIASLLSKEDYQAFLRYHKTQTGGMKDGKYHRIQQRQAILDAEKRAGP